MREIKDFKGEEAFDLIGEIAGYAESIFEDKEILDKFKSVKNGSEMPQNAFYFTVAKIMCQRYKLETMSIYAAINGISTKDLDLNPFEIIGQTVKILKECGESLIPLFFSSAQKTEKTSFGEPTENLEGKM
ncbi:MAG: hypothetical protein II453_10680 [Alphaproteobacteria bacterium]|nr:hypothetical protein [Alphaproteobacteria bacterium]